MQGKSLVWKLLSGLWNEGLTLQKLRGTHLIILSPVEKVLLV